MGPRRASSNAHWKFTGVESVQVKPLSKDVDENISYLLEGGNQRKKRLLRPTENRKGEKKREIEMLGKEAFDQDQSTS